VLLLGGRETFSEGGSEGLREAVREGGILVLPLKLLEKGRYELGCHRCSDATAPPATVVDDATGVFRDAPSLVVVDATTIVCVRVCGYVCARVEDPR